jgi:hypothetical protein
MGTPSSKQTRAERVREHAAAVARARSVVAAMVPLVRGREARARDGEAPLEVEFARIEVHGRALPAAVWVALRRDDVDAAIDVMTAASENRFLIEEHDVVGEGYRLQAVQDTVPMPDTDLLIAQLSDALGVPVDVLTLIAAWDPDDPRAASEIDGVLTSRFGPADPRVPRSNPIEPQPCPASVEAPREASPALTMTVADVAQVLRLDDDQVRALTVLVRGATVALTTE